MHCRSPSVFHTIDTFERPVLLILVSSFLNLQQSPSNTATSVNAAKNINSRTSDACRLPHQPPKVCAYESTVQRRSFVCSTSKVTLTPVEHTKLRSCTSLQQSIFMLVSQVACPLSGRLIGSGLRLGSFKMAIIPAFHHSTRNYSSAPTHSTGKRFLKSPSSTTLKTAKIRNVPTSH